MGGTGGYRTYRHNILFINTKQLLAQSLLMDYSLQCCERTTVKDTSKKLTSQ